MQAMHEPSDVLQIQVNTVTRIHVFSAKTNHVTLNL